MTGAEDRRPRAARWPGSRFTALFREDAGRHDSLRDLDWPAREGAAYYSALVNDEASLVTLARDGGHVAGHLIGKLSGPNARTEAPAQHRELPGSVSGS